MRVGIGRLKDPVVSDDLADVPLCFSDDCFAGLAGVGVVAAAVGLGEAGFAVEGKDGGGARGGGSGGVHGPGGRGRERKGIGER